MKKNITNTSHKVLSKNIILFLIAGLLALSAMVTLLAPKSTSVNADEILSNSDYSAKIAYKIRTNISGVLLNCERSTAGQFNLFKIFPPDISLGYQLVNVEKIKSSSEPSFVIQKNTDGSYYFSVSSSFDIVPENLVKGVLKKATPLPPDPTKEGHTFKGWFLDSACTIPYDGRPITEDISLYAGWTINTYTVTFDSVGGSAVATQTVNWNTAPTLSTPTKDGYNFVGWYNGATKYEGAVIKSNTTLTAKWEIKTFTVTFDSVGGSAVANQTVNWNTSATLSTPTKDGYNFVGWFIGDTKYIDGAIKENTTLTAKWEIKTFTVTFDSAGGSAVDPQTVTWNTSATVKDLERVGYIFLGWFNGETKYTDGAIKENTTLIAKWQIKKYTVTFMVDGEVYEVLEVEHGASLAVALEAAKLKDYSPNSITFDSGYISQENLTDLVITDNGSIDVAPLSDSQKAINFIQQFWLVGLLSIVGISFLLSISVRKKKKSV